MHPPPRGHESVLGSQRGWFLSSLQYPIQVRIVINSLTLDPPPSPSHSGLCKARCTREWERTRLCKEWDSGKRQCRHTLQMCLVTIIPAEKGWIVVLVFGQRALCNIFFFCSIVIFDLDQFIATPVVERFTAVERIKWVLYF